MIGRDKITVSFNGAAQTVYGTVVADGDGTIRPDGRSISATRLILPRTFAPPGGGPCNMSFEFGNRTARLETPIVPIYDGRGRVHHYEVVVRS